MPTCLITWTTYGTWLHGDARGSVTRETNQVGRPYDVRDADRRDRARRMRLQDVFVMDDARRRCVEDAVRAHAEHRGWRIHALNVRTNHVHVVVSAEVEPEKVMGQFKSWASRALHDGYVATDRKIWTRHGSTRWIKTDASLQRAIEYVTNEQ